MYTHTYIYIYIYIYKTLGEIAHRDAGEYSLQGGAVKGGCSGSG